MRGVRPHSGRPRQELAGRLLFWHLGLTCLIIVFTLGVRRIDYRVVLLGAILPDLIDKPIGRILFVDTFQTSRLFGHTLLLVTVVLLSIQLVLRGKTARRWFILPIASLIHLALDGMWNLPVTLFWPLFGTRFPPEPNADYWLDVFLRPFEDPLTLGGELVGLALLYYLYRAFCLQNPANRRQFVRTGKLVDRSGRFSDGAEEPEPGPGH